MRMGAARRGLTAPRACAGTSTRAPCLPLSSCAARTVAGQSSTCKVSGQACCLTSALLNSPILCCFAVTVSCFFSTSETQQVRFADPCLALYAPERAAAAGAKGEVVELRVGLGV